MHPPEIQQARARTHFETCRARQTSHQELATFWLATLQMDKGCEKISTEITRCPAKYVVGLYSTFAAKFDDLLLGQLDYQTPTRLRQLLDTVVVVHEKNKKNDKWHRAADLGCGTGLSGMAFSDIVNHLVGVDLSPAMLKHAKKRGIYDDLIQGELTCIFDKNDDNQRFDLVFACDVFVYLGDLSRVFESLSKSLRVTSGLFCFSTEYMKEGDDGSSRRFELHACARFSHKQSYIEGLCVEFAFEIVRLQICPIRLNQGKPVQGMLVILRLT
jgi:predicted TPR repeat methyltransferase